ncbi:Vinculin/alpha-catenin [Anaeromyces robustus]|uniref:Vinculin/alpha-catenin n=1 Tax=Anaeromyces robustus TaxID=1754192 RepID=A0A1Y1X9B0_9FUNG|nr:Vinculin/alpha-catenin [Anaeromyces robustus]|eukprot:ORX82343.1 Vinculin/alpha-catenin [Anaeromyces robustus]
MFTATTKEVISPIADVVSQLIIRNAEAEQNNAYMEDISEYATNVCEQIKKFSDVVLSIISSKGTDEILIKEMNEGNLIVQKAAENLLSAAKYLKEDPHSSKGRGLLVDATKGILEGVTSLLNSYDDYNVRIIVQLCDELIGYYQQCRDNTDPQKIIDAIKLCSRYSVKLASLSTQRIQELLSANLKKELQSAIDLLTKTSPLLISSCKAYLQNPQKEATKNGFHNVCDTLIHATNEIKRIVQISEVDDTAAVKIGELTELVNGMENDEKDMIKAIMDKDVDAFNTAQAAYNKKANEFIKEASDVVDKVDDENERNKLQDLVEGVRTSTNSVDVMGSKCALQKFDDDLANNNLINQIKYNTASAKYVNGELNRQLMSNMAKTCNDISNKDDETTSFGNAYKKATSGEGQLKKEDIDRLSNSIDKLNDDYKTMNDKVSSEHDASVNENIEKNKENVEKMKNVLLDALQATAENPNEPNLKKHLDSVANVWTDQVQALKSSLIVEPGLFTTQELLNNTMGTFTKCMKKLETEGDNLSDEEKEQLYKEALAAAKQFLEVAKNEMNNTEDEAYRMELLKNIQEVEKVLPILSQPYSASNKTDLQSAARKLGSILGSLNSIMKTKLPPAPAVLEPPEKPVIQERPIVSNVPAPETVKTNVASTPTQATILEPEEEEEEEQPEVEPLQQEEAKAFPIKAAGRDLKMEAAQWSGSKNDIINKVNIVAQKMEELSLIHSKLNTNPIAKKEMIQKALEITQVTQSILKDCRELAELCTDKRLKMQLLNTVDRLNTLSQQLRVVTAVKASNPNDLDTDNQLFSCAFNLTETMKRLLRDSEAASVRCNFKTSGTAALAIIKFKKNLKKSKAGGAAGAFKKPVANTMAKSVGNTLQQ